MTVLYSLKISEFPKVIQFAFYTESHTPITTPTIVTVLAPNTIPAWSWLRQKVQAIDITLKSLSLTSEKVSNWTQKANLTTCSEP